MMRNALVLVLVGSSGCATTRPTAPTTPVRYACGDVAVTRHGGDLMASSSDLAMRLSWRDDHGDHFLSRSLAPTDRKAVEIVVPNDPRQDATKNVYDTTHGSSSRDWNLVDRRMCTAEGGYSDVLTRWIKGDSIERVAADLRLDRAHARGLVRTALVSAQRRYWSGR